MLLQALQAEGFAPNNMALGALLGYSVPKIYHGVQGRYRAYRNKHETPEGNLNNDIDINAQSDTSKRVGDSTLTKDENLVPLSVNYHFSRKCNYSCGFCFHTETTSHIATLTQAKQAMSLLAQAGMKKINFAGGEPFLYKTFLGKLVDYCKEELQLESVSIVSNGSNITREWLQSHAKNLDILAVSCDSFNEQTNIEIGRGTGEHIPKLFKVADWCREFGIMFKLNTVVCKPNVLEDMNEQITRLNPYRWKCFQVLLVAGENDSATTKRDARKFQIEDEQFDEFCRRHRGQKAIVPESNRVMAKSYLILDEYLRFLDRTGQQPSRSILEVGVEKALRSVFWDKESFEKRGGVYAWNEEMVDKEKEENSKQSQRNDDKQVDEESDGGVKTAEDGDWTTVRNNNLITNDNVDSNVLAQRSAQMTEWHSQVSGGGGCGGGIGRGNGAINGVGDMEDLGQARSSQK